MIPYGRQIIDEEDIKAVTDVLTSDWLTTGPMVATFEEAFAQFVGAPYAVSLSSGTAALHSAMYAIGIGPGDEVIVPSMTFAATANAVVYQGGTPIFADVHAESLLLDVTSVAAKITPQTKAIICMDYAGQACDYESLRDIARSYKLLLVADSCHSLGGDYRGQAIGSLADLTAFSFHPVKHITSGEGGMVSSDHEHYATKIRQFRNHGIVSDHHQRQEEGTWHYEMQNLGYNYRLTDIQCALANSQLKKLPKWLQRRRQIASFYDAAFEGMTTLRPLSCSVQGGHAYHLYVVRLNLKRLEGGQLRVFNGMRGQGVGVNVHYIPVHLHPYYKKNYGTRPGDCPVAEQAYGEILSLPMSAALTDEELGFVSQTLVDIVGQADTHVDLTS